MFLDGKLKQLLVLQEIKFSRYYQDEFNQILDADKQRV